MLLRQIFDPNLAQYSYLIGCPASGEAVLIDPQRDVDRYLALATAAGVEIVAVAETHLHADFLSGARELACQHGVRIYLSAEGGAEWRYAWVGPGIAAPSGVDTVMLRDGDVFTIGSVEFQALHTPGHTPEHLSYLVTDRGAGADRPVGILSGDFVLVGDLGRPDLLEEAVGIAGSREASARELHRSTRTFLELADDLLVWPAHGAGSSCGKSIGDVPVSTVGYEKRFNRSLVRAGEGEEAFVAAILRDQPTPPTYFARMKQENRAGPALLRRLPRPRRLDAADLASIVTDGETVVVDTRTDRGAFMRAHLPGSLYAPLDRSFTTTIGALLVDAGRSIVLLIQESSVEAAVRDLVRIGYDSVIAHFDAATLHDYLEAGGERGTIEEVDFAGMASRRRSGDYLVVDVRDHFEYAEGHVPGAINAPHLRLPEYLPVRIPPQRPLIVHCESGVRSATASAWLATQGREVLYVNGHWSDWPELGGEVERGG